MLQLQFFSNTNALPYLPALTNLSNVGRFRNEPHRKIHLILWNWLKDIFIIIIAWKISEVKVDDGIICNVRLSEARKV